jgi:hypothetical protein
MRKYNYLWVIQGYYKSWEDLSAYTIWREAAIDLKAYYDNEAGTRFRLIQRREKRT